VLRKIREARPDVVFIWDPYVGQTSDAIVTELANANEDAIVIRIPEYDFDDGLVLARLELDAFLAEWEIVDSPSGQEIGASAIAQPADGEERYYRKLHGSAVGDVMRRLEDCGHNQWQSSNKAPRAWKGIERMEGVTPQMLFRCMRGGCRRWRARF
jgi:hypothetical protein